MFTWYSSAHILVKTAAAELKRIKDMKTGNKIAILGGLAVVAGSAACWRWMIRMPLKEFTRYALYMAVMDDEICRNELEGNQIGAEVLMFPPKVETLQERYHLFLQMNRAKSRQQIQKEIAEKEQRLQESRQYIGQPKEQLEVETSEEMICDKPISVYQV